MKKKKNKHKKEGLEAADFFTEYKEAYRYYNLRMIGKGSYGDVCVATDRNTKERVAIKRIKDVFRDTKNARQTLREIKLLKILRHPNVVQVKRIMLPPTRHDFREIYVVFELMDSDLQKITRSTDPLTHDQHRTFLHQMLRALKYLHTAKVYHRDLKPNNILQKTKTKLKICDFGLAKVEFDTAPYAKEWTKYDGTRNYYAPELCGYSSSKCTPAMDIWSIGCIFAEVLTRQPLFPGKNRLDRLNLITNLLGTPSVKTISGFQDEKIRKYLTKMPIKEPVLLSEKIPNADPLALDLLQRLLAFDPKDRPTAEQALAHQYFESVGSSEKDPSCLKISKSEFEFEDRQLTIEDLRELIFEEISKYPNENDRIRSTINSVTNAQEFELQQNVSMPDNMQNSGKIVTSAASDEQHIFWDRPSRVLQPLCSESIPQLKKIMSEARDGNDVENAMSEAKDGKNLDKALSEAKDEKDVENAMSEAKDGKDLDKAMPEAKKYTSKPVGQTIENLPLEPPRPMSIDNDGNPRSEAGNAESSAMDSETDTDAESVQEQTEKLERLIVD